MILHVILQNELNNQHIPSNEQFQQWVDAIFHFVDNHVPVGVDEVCFRIVAIDESAVLNESFRQKQGATNVLSFPNDPEHPEDKSLGDIAICADLVESEANELGLPIKNHWAHLTIHGVLHLLGYDHIEENDAIEMENLEIQILEYLKIENPYKEPFDEND